MNNIVSNTPSMTANIMNARRKDDGRDAINQLELLNALYLHDALITKISPVNSDEYIIDIYDQGFTLETGAPAAPTRVGLIAHAMHTQDWYSIEHCQVGQRVLVHLLSDNSAWIKHPEEPQLGVVVCDDCDGGNLYSYPPDAQEDGERQLVDSELQSAGGPAGGPPGGTEPSLANLPPNYYRVAFARIWNQDGSLPHDYRAFPRNHPLYNIVASENLLERNCKSHYVRPGTVVVLKWNYDNQTPPQRRYFFECADEGTCGMSTCSTSSSSSSSSSCGAVCVYTWTVSWDCLTKSFSAPTWISNCDVPVTMTDELVSSSGSSGSGSGGGGGGTTGGGGFPPLDVWIYDGTRNGKCWFHYNQVTEQCCDQGVPCDQPPPYPGDPPYPDRCCYSSSSSSSGSCNTGLCCWYLWEQPYDCSTQSFGSPIVTPICDDCTDPAEYYLDPRGTTQLLPQNKWINGQDQSGNCVFFYLQKTLQCCNGDGDCVSIPDFPGNPPNPEICCPSSSSGSRSGSGSTGPCNPIAHINFGCQGRNNYANITYCDGTTETQTWPCCCDNPSSSSSRSMSSHSRSGSGPVPDDGYCYYKYVTIYDCNSGQLGPVVFDNFSCGDMFGAPDIDRWYIDYKDGNYCQLMTVLMGGRCDDSLTGDCGDDVDMPPVFPNPPSLTQAQDLCNCPSISSSSGSDSGSTGGSIDLTSKYYKLWRCPSDVGGQPTESRYFVHASDVVNGLPYYGLYVGDNACYTVPAGAVPLDTATDTILSLDEHSDCTCARSVSSITPSGSQGPSDDQTWMQLRDCNTGFLINKWINVTHHIMTDGRIRDNTTGKCYEGGPNNPLTSTDPGNVINSWSFTDEDCDNCGLYWRIRPCASAGFIGDLYITKRAKEYMQNNGITAFRISPGTTDCYEILAASETNDLRGGTIVSVIRTYADCDECSRNPL